MDYDVTELATGDFISPVELEGYIECNRDHREYSLRLVAMAKKIEKKLWSIGRCWTVVCDKDGIRILTPSQAIDYTAISFDLGRKKMRLAHRRAQAVDLSSVPEDKRKHHIETMTRNANILASMRQRKAIELEATVRTTPVVR